MGAVVAGWGGGGLGGRYRRALLVDTGHLCYIICLKIEG